MYCENKNIGFKVLSACKSCRLYRQGQEYALRDIIPKGHCFELLHSLIPYIVTFNHGGWFKWQRSKSKVVVCCLSVLPNACVELQKMPKAGSFKYKILKTKGRCPFYKEGQIFRINKEDFNELCWELFNIIFPYTKVDCNKVSVSCLHKDSKASFELFSV